MTVLIRWLSADLDVPEAIWPRAFLVGLVLVVYGAAIAWGVLGWT